MKQITAVAGLILSLAIVGCSSTKVMEYEGAKVLHGNGGARETVDGIDFWKVGEPNGDYQIVGIVEDEYVNNGSPLGNLLSASSSRSRIVKAAKEKGANGVIFISRQRTVTGASGQIDRNGSFYANQHETVNRQAALIKYIR